MGNVLTPYAHPHPHHHQGASRPAQPRDVVIRIPDILFDLEKGVLEFQDTISNLKKEKRLTSEQIQFLLFKMNEAGHWLHRHSTARYIDNQQAKSPSKPKQPSPTPPHRQQASQQPQQQQANLNCVAQVRQLQEMNEELNATVNSLGDQVTYHKKEIKRLENEKSDLVIRLSKVAGQKLTQDNPAIADLSDKNRPTKIGEMYNELYDNEWTDAFESLLKVGYNEEEAIETLRDTLLNSFEFCHKKSDMLISKVSDAVNFLFEEYKLNESIKVKAIQLSTVPPQSDGGNGDALKMLIFQNKWKPRRGFQSSRRDENDEMKSSLVKCEEKLKTLRKDVAVSIAPIVQKAYLKASWDQECIPAMKPFIKKCLFIGWMMVVQSPPLCYHADSKPGQRFDSNKYRQYTTTGNTVDYIVWPALQLHDNGPIVCKGVAATKADKK